MITYDGSFMHIVTSPPEFDHRQAVTSVVLADPACQSAAVPLTAYDDISVEPKLKRLGSSTMAVFSVYPQNLLIP